MFTQNLLTFEINISDNELLLKYNWYNNEGDKNKYSIVTTKSDCDGRGVGAVLTNQICLY